MPEGASIKSADDGVVAYAGNELKGYGNLVLVRHAGGFVTAYAHASEMLVKRGDHVKRGQIIARAGQTGNVTSPQLHFEIRKGSTPVDPTQYLRIRRRSARTATHFDQPKVDLQGLIKHGAAALLPDVAPPHFSAISRRLTPSRPARSCTYCQATRPEREPRVVAHSSASRRSSSGVDRDAVVPHIAFDHGQEFILAAAVEAKPQAEPVR